MNTDIQVLLAIVVAGVVGGLVNAFLSDNGFAMPKRETTPAGGSLWRPGYLGNVLVSVASAVISWGLYGPYATHVLIPGRQEERLELSVANLVGALLVGVAGSRWLTNEVDKNLMKAAVTAAAIAPADPAKAAALVNASPSQTLQLAKGAHGLPALPEQPD